MRSDIIVAFVVILSVVFGGATAQFDYDDDEWSGGGLTGGGMMGASYYPVSHNGRSNYGSGYGHGYGKSQSYGSVSYGTGYGHGRGGGSGQMQGMRSSESGGMSPFADSIVREIRMSQPPPPPSPPSGAPSGLLGAFGVSDAGYQEEVFGQSSSARELFAYVSIFSFNTILELSNFENSFGAK